MTVDKLIKILQKMPPKAKVCVDVSYSGKKDWKYEMVELTPKFIPQVEMNEDWVCSGRARYVDMLSLGVIVGDTLE